MNTSANFRQSTMTPDAQLSRSLLKNGLLVFLAFNLFIETLSWYIAYKVKMNDI